VRKIGVGDKGNSLRNSKDDDVTEKLKESDKPY